MNAPQPDEFQEKVAALIVRNSNLLDILTKCQTACGKICRSSIKSATGCGCVKITAEQTLTALTEKNEFSPREMSGVNGYLCGDCRSSVEKEIGELLFYIASLCNALGLSMNEIMTREIKNVEYLGKYSLR